MRTRTISARCSTCGRGCEVPVYATPFTAALLEAKRQGEPGAPDIPVNVVPLGGRISLGPFDIEFVSMAHSIPESNGLIIRTRLGTVLHTGDWKIDPTPVIGPPTDEAKLRALGDEGCLALVGDSTNAVREGRSPSETDVAKIAGRADRQRARRASAVTTFASNVARIRAVAEAAAACGREVVLVGRAMERIVAGRARDRLSRRHPRVPLARHLRLPAARQGAWRSAPAARASRAPRWRASPRTSIRRSRFSRGRPRDLLLAHHPGQREGGGAGDQRPGQPGHRGHHRPHPSRARLRPSAPRRAGGDDRLGAAANPHSGAWRAAAPGRARRRSRAAPASARSWPAATATWCGSRPARRRSSTRCRPAGSTRTARCWSTRGERTVPDRRRLGFAGIVSVALAMTERGELVGDPEVELTGIPDERRRRQADRRRSPTRRCSRPSDSLPRARRRDPDAVAEAARRAVRAAVGAAWSKKPMCHVHVLTV